MRDFEVRDFLEKLKFQITRDLKILSFAWSRFSIQKGAVITAWNLLVKIIIRQGIETNKSTNKAIS